MTNLAPTYQFRDHIRVYFESGDTENHSITILYSWKSLSTGEYILPSTIDITILYSWKSLSTGEYDRSSPRNNRNLTHGGETTYEYEYQSEGTEDPYHDARFPEIISGRRDKTTPFPTNRILFHLIFGATPVEELHIDQPQPGTQELTTQFQ